MAITTVMFIDTFKTFIACMCTKLLFHIR